MAVSRQTQRRPVLLTPLLGLVVAALAIGYAESTGKHVSDVLFSGQEELPGLIENAATYSIGALLLLLVCKGLAYGASLSSFRGGPTFPAMFIGAAGGIAMSHLPGLALVPAIAMGIGAMTVGILRLPLTAVLVTTLFLGADGFLAMPLVIVTVVISYIVTIRLSPPPTPAPETERPAPARGRWSPPAQTHPPRMSSGGRPADGARCAGAEPLGHY